MGALQKDKKSLEEMVEATKARNTELVQRVQKLQVSHGISLHTKSKLQRDIINKIVFKRT